MAGKRDMTLHGLRQLAEWSIEHSCLEPERRDKIHREWEEMWDAFVQWIIKEYGDLAEETGKDSSGP